MQVKVRNQNPLQYCSKLFDIPLLIIKEANKDLNISRENQTVTVKIPGYVRLPYKAETTDTINSICHQFSVNREMLHCVNDLHIFYKTLTTVQIFIPKRIENNLITDVDLYSFDKLEHDLKKLTVLYPFIRQNTIGKSVLGKDLYEIRIGNGKKEVHVSASIHGNEWITTPVITRFINQYALSLTNNLSHKNVDVLGFYEECTFCFLPMVNPDGVDLVVKGASSAEEYAEQVIQMNLNSDDFSNWKANIRGVDLNKQFPAGWEIEADRKPKKAGPRDFPGTSPLTEPESIALVSYLSRHVDHISRLITLHTQGEEIYWAFSNYEVPRAKEVVMKFAKASGYKPIKHLDNYAGLKDWFIQEYQIEGYTIELGRGTNPLPIESFDQIYHEGESILLTSLYA